MSNPINKSIAGQLSVIIPVFNEEARILQALIEVKRCKFINKVVIVDDGSTDKSQIIIKQFVKNNSRFKLVVHENNCGKGMAVRTALKYCNSELIAIHDADLEYDPKILKIFLNLFENSSIDVVYGSRFVGSDPRFVHYFWHSAANKFLTRFTNLLLDLNLTDMEVCQKMFRSTLINKIILKENRFGFEPEVTVKLARLGARFYEVGVPYMGRRREEGKKIRWIDGVRALYCLILYSLISKKNWTK